mgnify:CR=1 FL=1
MKQLEKVQNNTTWAKASNAINNNNDALYVAVTTLEHAAFKNKGYFKSVALLYGAYPTAENGAQAFVYNSSNPTSAPYDIYEWVNGAWQDSGINGGSVNVNLDSKQDTLVGYSESVSGGKATQVAIQGDTIALSGKVSLGNVDNMESAILMSSSQAGAAIAKANTVEQSMSALKSPVKPIHLNSQGKLELSIGKGLYIEDGKLCTTGASGGGGGGTTLSEGQGIRIYNDTINVAYDIDTLRVNSCGGLTVNYGEGLTIKNGKLSAQASVNAGNGLVKKGDELSVNISTGLQYGSDGELAVKTGKGLSVDNTGTINANIDNSTIATNSNGAMYVKKGMLAGQGLKVSLDRLAVNYGDGLTISNKALVIDYGAGLDIQNGKLVSTSQGGKTYVSGQAVNITGNEINVKYDGVTISTKDSSDNSLHVMLGSGLKQGSNGIDVAVGAGLAIGSDNKLYSTVSSGKTYTAGDGIDINGNKIAVLYGSGLTTNTCGKLIVDAANLSVKNADMLAGQALGYSNGKVPLYTPFPGFNALISMGYLRSDYASNGYPTEDFLKAICKWAIATYPNTGEILMGRAAPSDSGFLILSMYSTSGYDATSLLPRYCTGWYLSLGGKSFRFYTVNYVWSMSEMASLDSTVAKATTADKATADANGNYITETYARRFMPTYGLEINSDRELFLPNLTASVINGAADGSKNGAQRVLNLSCGAIQIKLSTGLAIDELGYLYVQDKNVIK